MKSLAGAPPPAPGLGAGEFQARMESSDKQVAGLSVSGEGPLGCGRGPLGRGRGWKAWHGWQDTT